MLSESATRSGERTPPRRRVSTPVLDAIARAVLAARAERRGEGVGDV